MGSIGELSQSLRRTRSARVSSVSSSRFNPASTPIIHEAPPSFSRQRGGATPTKTTGPDIPPPKPKFSAEEQIKILERIKAGDFKKTMGLEQFRIEKDLTGEVQAHSKSKKGKKKKDKKKEPVLPVLSPSKELPDFTEFMGGQEKNYAALPNYIKRFDSILVAQLTSFKIMYKNASLFADVTFAKALKPKVIVSVHRRMARLTNIIQKFLRLSAWDKAQVLNPGKPERTKQGEQRSHFHCHLDDHKKVAESVLNVTLDLERLRQFLAAQNPEELNLKMIEIQKLTDAVESKLKKLSDATVKFNEAFKRAEDLEMVCDALEEEEEEEEDDTSDSSSGSSDDEDSEDEDDKDSEQDDDEEDALV